MGKKKGVSRREFIRETAAGAGVAAAAAALSKSS